MTPAEHSFNLRVTQSMGDSPPFLNQVIGFNENIRHPLISDRMTIGRFEGCEIVVGAQGSAVSRRHARVHRAQNMWWIEDLNSRNHTFVNGKNISGRGPVPLSHADRIQICNYEFVFCEDDLNPKLEGSIHLFDEEIGDDTTISFMGDPLKEEVGTDVSLSVLLKVTSLLQNVLSLDDVLNEVLNALFRVFSVADRGVIGFFNDRGEFEPRWWKIREELGETRIEVSRTIVNRVASSQKAMILNDVQRQFPESDSALRLRIRSVMCAPLMQANGRTFGVFQIDSYTENGFSQRDLQLVTAIAIQASLAINNAQLHETALKQHAMQKDLELAQQVQEELLPQKNPEVSGYRFASTYRAAKEIGGDYVDFVHLDDGRIAIVLADVGGKGIPAALYMSRLATQTRTCLDLYDQPAQVIGELNRRMTQRFTTFVLAVLHPKSHEVVIVNAGHRPPLWKRADGEVIPVGEEIVGYPFSAVDDAEFDEVRITLEPGESIALFSDGVEDAFNANNNQRFGYERAQSILSRTTASPSDTINLLVGEVDAFSAGTPQFDDICIVVVSRIEPAS